MALSKAVVKQKTDTVKRSLDMMKEQMVASLPQHLSVERMTRITLNAVQNTPKLLECDQNSLLLSVLRAAQLGLEPDGVLGQAYLLPYAGKVQLIVGYKGLIDLARRSGEVSNIIAKEVCERDEFELCWHEEVPFRHRPPINGKRGEVIGFWAMARFKDGGFHFDYMSREEVLAIRDQSSGWQTAVKYKKAEGSPWQKHFVEMGKKTVIRRIAKYLPMSVQRANAVENAVDAGVPVNMIKDTETGEVFDDAFDMETGEIIEGEVAEPETKTKEVKEAVADRKSKKPAETKPAEPLVLTPETNYLNLSSHDLDQAVERVRQGLGLYPDNATDQEKYMNAVNGNGLLNALNSRGRVDEYTEISQMLAYNV